MILYLSTILSSMFLITVLNYLFAFGAATFLTILAWVVVATVAQIVIDAVLATLVRWILPAKMFGVDKKRFMASRKERIFYEKIGIKKWKDCVLELGAVTGFRKNKLGDVSDNKYIERFIVEANYGIAVHVACIVFGITVMFVCPKVFWFAIGAPVTVVNIILNLLPFFILRYNLPKLHALYKFNEKRQGPNV